MPGRLIVFVVLAFCCVLSAAVAVALMSPSIVAAQDDARDARATAAAQENVCQEAIRAMAAAAVLVAPSGAGGFVDSFAITCATTATPIESDTGQRLAGFSCVNDSAVLVAVGDKNLAAPLAADSPVICSNCTAGAVWNPQTQDGYCRVDSGTQAIECIGVGPRPVP